VSEPFGSPKDRFYEIEKEIGEFESSWCRSDEVLTVRVHMWHMRCELYQVRPPESVEMVSTGTLNRCVNYGFR